jgi:hypothetical protein
LVDTYGSTLVRTDLRDDDAWQALLSAIETPSEEGFLATVRAVSDPALDGLAPDVLVSAMPPTFEASFLLVADATTLGDAEQPILVVPVPRRYIDRTRQPFRVVPSRLWSIENNLSLGNMDWSSYADSTDADGVFRGFQC